MSVINQLSSPVMYMICGGIIAFVAVICVVFAVRAWRAGKAIGMDTARMKQAVTASVTFSILPSVGILLGVIALSGSLGIPWPWLRLSVIGALHYETQVAQAAAEQLGTTLSGETMTADAFSTIALLMSVCIMWGMIFTTLFGKKYLARLSRGNENKAGQDKPSFGDKAMTAMFIGLVSAYMGSYLGQWISGQGRFDFSGSLLPLATALFAALVMMILTLTAERKKARWLEDFSLALSMLAGMAFAALAASVL